MKEYKVKLPCGINKDGKVLYIDDAKNGLACECFCPGCKQALIARNGGTERQHHFMHSHNVNCEHGYQSALHYMAKDLFLEMEYLTFVKDGKTIKYKIDYVELEYKIGNIIPDILITCDGKQFIVEIFVTHAVDDEKKEKIKSLKISAVEIDFSRFKNDLIDKEILKQELQNPDNFSWVYDADYDLTEQKRSIIQQFGLKIPIGLAGAIYCPILAMEKKDYLRIVPLDFCLHCPNCVYKTKENFIYCGRYLPLPVHPNGRSGNIFVNENKVMFNDEFRKFDENFAKELENARRRIIQTLENIAVNQYRHVLNSLSVHNQQQNNRTNHHRPYNKKRRGFY